MSPNDIIKLAYLLPKCMLLLRIKRPARGTVKSRGQVPES